MMMIMDDDNNNDDDVLHVTICNDYIVLKRSPDERSENFTKQPVDKYRKISFSNLCV